MCRIASAVDYYSPFPSFSRDPTFVIGCKFPFWLVLSSFYPVSCWSYQSYRSDFRTTQLDIKGFGHFLEFPKKSTQCLTAFVQIFPTLRNGFWLRFPCWISSFLPAGSLVSGDSGSGLLGRRPYVWLIPHRLRSLTHSFGPP